MLLFYTLFLPILDSTHQPIDYGSCNWICSQGFTEILLKCYCKPLYIHVLCKCYICGNLKIQDGKTYLALFYGCCDSLSLKVNGKLEWITFSTNLIIYLTHSFDWGTYLFRLLRTFLAFKIYNGDMDNTFMLLCWSWRCLYIQAETVYTDQLYYA